MRIVQIFLVLLAGCCAAEALILVDGADELVASEYPLGVGALDVRLTVPKDYLQWDEQQLRSAYGLLQTVTTLWRDSRFADDYLLQGRCSTEPFRWQIVPYPEHSQWKLVKIIYHVAFGAPQLSEEERGQLSEQMRHGLAGAYPVHVKDRSGDKRVDAFCNPSIVTRQTVYSGERVTVLQDYAPNRGSVDHLHFLVIPKACKKEFAELSAGEFVEIQQVTQRLVGLFREKGYPIAYLFSNNGINSGQSVPHFHQHIVFVKDEVEGLWDKWARFFAYLIPSKPLPRDRVDALTEKHKKLIGILRSA